MAIIANITAEHIRWYEKNLGCSMTEQIQFYELIAIQACFPKSNKSVICFIWFHCYEFPSDCRHIVHSDYITKVELIFHSSRHSANVCYFEIGTIKKFILQYRKTTTLTAILN